jgi:transcriptional regulator with XRE-family HTH domain
LISRLRAEFETRAAYIKAKVGTLVPSQIRALRLKSEMPRQADLANAADMKQSRISMMETPGAANMTLDTLSSIAAALKVGLKVEFVPFSEMLAWENGFSQDQFDVVKIDNDLQFLNPINAIQAQPVPYLETQVPILTNAKSFWNTFGIQSSRVGIAGLGSLRYITAKDRNVPINEYVVMGVRGEITHINANLTVSAVPAPPRSAIEEFPIEIAGKMLDQKQAWEA